MKNLSLLLFLILPFTTIGQTAEEYFEEGKKHLITSNYEKALTAFNKSIAIDPHKPDVWSNRGNAKMKLRDFDGALADFRRSLSYRTDFPTLYMRAEIYKKQQKWVEAVNDYERIISRDPKQFNAYRYGIEIFSGLGYFEHAEEWIDIFSENFPHEKYRFHTLRGNYYLNKGEHQRAMAEFDTALRENHFDLAYRGKGKTFFAMGDPNQALKLFEQAIQNGDNSAKAYHYRAATKKSLGDVEGAMADFNQAIVRDRNAAGTYAQRAALKAETGDLQGALSDYNVALEITPDFNQALSGRGVINFTLEQYADSSTDFEKFIQLMPDSGEAYIYLAKANIILGKNRDALAYTNKALELLPEVPEPYMVRGILKIDSEEYPQALEDLNKALQLAPDFAAALYHRGTAHSKLNRIAEACADYNKALSLGITEAKTDLSAIGCN